MGIIKGDIRRALGFKTIKVDGLEISLDKTTAQDIVDFQEIPIRAIKGKNKDQLSTNDLLEINSVTTQWFVDYFMNKDDSLTKEDVELFVAKNKRELQKEFTIGFGIKSRESYERDEAEAEKSLEKKD